MGDHENRGRPSAASVRRDRSPERTSDDGKHHVLTTLPPRLGAERTSRRHVLGLFLGNIDLAVTDTATPAIHADLGASGGELELIVSGYILAYSMLLITGARLGQVRGYRRTFLLGLGVFTAASLACGLAPPRWC